MSCRQVDCLNHVYQQCKILKVWTDSFIREKISSIIVKFMEGETKRTLSMQATKRQSVSLVWTRQFVSSPTLSPIALPCIPFLFDEETPLCCEASTDLKNAKNALFHTYQREKKVIKIWTNHEIKGPFKSDAVDLISAYAFPSIYALCHLIKNSTNKTLMDRIVIECATDLDFFRPPFKRYLEGIKVIALSCLFQVFLKEELFNKDQTSYMIKTRSLPNKRCGISFKIFDEGRVEMIRSKVSSTMLTKMPRLAVIIEFVYQTLSGAICPERSTSDISKQPYVHVFSIEMRSGCPHRRHQGLSYVSAKIGYVVFQLLNSID